VTSGSCPQPSGALLGSECPDPRMRPQRSTLILQVLWPSIHGDRHGPLRARAGPGADHDAGLQPGEQRRSSGHSSETTWTAPSSGMPRRYWPSSVPGSTTTTPSATLGARDAEPGRLPGWSYSKLLAVSRTLGSTPARLSLRARRGQRCLGPPASPAERCGGLEPDAHFRSERSRRVAPAQLRLGASAEHN
jgi:hypothetical protein